MTSTYFSGGVSKRALAGKILPVGIGVLVSTLLVANLAYPEAFDWRYVVVSALLDANDLPGWYLLPSIGMSIAGVVLFPVIGYFNKRLAPTCKGAARTGSFFMLLGIIGLISVGTIGQIIHTINKFHEILAGVAFIGFLFSAFFHGMPILKARRKGDTRFNVKGLSLAWAFLWVAVAGMAGSAIYLEVAGDPSWGWVSMNWISQGVPAILSFALWEWVLLVAILVYLVALVAAVPGDIIEGSR